MNAEELIEWLLIEGIAAELAVLVRINALQDLGNVEPAAQLGQALAGMDWNRLLFAGSILARSEARRPREAALLIATTAITCAERGPLRDAAALLFEQLSNRLAVTLAQRKEELGYDLDGRLGVGARLELARNRLRNSVVLEANGGLMEVNAFQRAFWIGAQDAEGWLSASAPTASGKTFLVLQWVLDQVRSERARMVVYLAPTRALVSETETNLKKLLSQAKIDPDSIRVSSLPLSDEYIEMIKGGPPLIVVFTQERLHLFANALGDKMGIDLLVVDEAHKIGDTKRGVILQDAIERVTRASPAVRAVFISPATQNPEALLDDAPPDSERTIIDSDAPTVLQNVVFAQQVRKKTTKYQLSVRTGDEVEEIGILNLPHRPTGLQKRVAFIAEALTGDRSGTLVYANGPDEAEKIAFLLNQDAQRDQIDPELAALADLSRKGVHPGYLLAPLVERGVAFHYGNMPSLLRSEIERLFKTGKIRFLVCTSTLIEGVNLSCRMIVLRGPRKGRTQHMLAHDFWNLAGRAGRWGDEFQGTIVCIDPYSEEAWPNGVPKRARYKIKRETDAVLDAPEQMIGFISSRNGMAMDEVGRNTQLEQVSSYLVATFLRSGSIEGAAFTKRHDPRVVKRIDEALARLCVFNRIPPAVVARHPGVNAIGMQSLLEFFEAYEGAVEDLLPATTEDDEALQSMMLIMSLINDHLFPAFKPDTLLYGHAITVQRWLSGWSLARMIEMRIRGIRSKGETPDVSKICRQTMEMVEQTARFSAPKYLAAYVDVLQVHLAGIDRPDLLRDEFDIGLALEFGISTRTLLSLMELGLSRMSAVAAYEIIAKDDLDQEACREWMRMNGDALVGTGLPIIILRELREKLVDDTSSAEGGDGSVA
ncbi:DEAD/DEAH box helicase [Mesorhizobium sp. WSM2561]|uniref:DEAD/DEAH box helicase n=1 Tax=Mesorhizobium sp. WSM2561 TaxID=1040985 RepID=UPI00048807D1|nr:DEAD/DEAH box helicase [Mesorhizobium sp. WSM2561]